ncbi:MAG: cellulose binding domain-containing protein [Chloroflexota bacterium]
MYKKMFKPIATLVAVVMLMVLSLQAVQAAKLLAPYTMNPTATSGGGGSRYSSRSILSSEYIVQTNLWNPPVAGGYTLAGDNTSAAWTVSNYTANSYFPGNNEPGCPAPGGMVDDCHWAGTGGFYENPLPPFSATNDPSDFVNREIHAPASYPSVYKGCHWGNCTANNGAPFPVQVQSVASLQSQWSIVVPGGTNPSPATDGVWDAAYDIWLDSNSRINPDTGLGYLPTYPEELDYNGTEPWNSLGQNDGAEIMIWMNSSGYDFSDAGGPIRPAGVFGNAVRNVMINGLSWDVWVARVHSYDNNTAWNVISYVLPPGQKITNLNMDTAPFLHDAMTRQCTPDVNDLRFPAAERGVPVPCAEPDWWLTSIQAGFEIWNLPQTLTMQTTNFSVTPVVVSGANTGNRSLDNGTPLVHWDDLYTITATGCPGGGTATYTITAQETGISSSTTLVETPAGSGTYVGTQNPSLHSLGMHGYATTRVVFPGCNGLIADGIVFIDPSGTVTNLAGEPVVDATVTLYYSPTGAPGSFTQATNGDPNDPSDDIMDPAINDVNPSQTNQYGFYRWDVIPGFYRVLAQKSDCGIPVWSDVLEVVDFPVTDVNLVLACGNPPPVTVQVTHMSDWPTGYCRNVIVTNNTSAPLDWTANFQTDGQIYNFWNVVWSQSGNNVTIQGVDWNNILQPGQSTHSIGFCANR